MADNKLPRLTEVYFIRQPELVDKHLIRLFTYQRAFQIYCRAAAEMVSGLDITQSTAPKLMGLERIHQGSVIISSIIMLEFLGCRRTAIWHPRPQCIHRPQARDLQPCSTDETQSQSGTCQQLCRSNYPALLNKQQDIYDY